MASVAKTTARIEPKHCGPDDVVVDGLGTQTIGMPIWQELMGDASVPSPPIATSASRPSRP